MTTTMSVTAYARAREIGSLGTCFFSPQETGRVLGAKIPESLPGIPLPEEFFWKLKAQQCQVLYQSDQFIDGTPLTLQALYERRKNQDAFGARMLYSADKPDCRYLSEELWSTQIPQNGWFVKARDVIPNTAGKNCVQQSLIVASFVEELFGDKLLQAGQDAITELRDIATALEKQCAGNDWQKGARAWAGLSFVKLFLPTPVEVQSQVLIVQDVNRERLFASVCGRTKQLSANGFVVLFGVAGAGGTVLDRWEPDDPDDDLGCFLSCSAELWAGS